MTPLTSVLIVDDEPAVRRLMARWVESLGLEPMTAANAEEAVNTLKSTHCDLAVIDVMMPGRNGLWLAAELRRDHPDTAVILATGNPRMVSTRPPPVVDLLIKPFKRDRFVLAVDRGREWRRQAVAETEWHAHLLSEFRRRVESIQQAVESERAAGRDEADALWKLASEQAPDVVEHSERVARYTVSIASELGLENARLPFYEQAARFHDIGKMAIPETVRLKPSGLTQSEVDIMRRHVEAGFEILEATTTLKELGQTVHASHEWFGGTGYPERLSGTSIPLLSRIIAVADAYDAMTQEHLYRDQLDSQEAASELLRCTPGQFDPGVVVAFLNVLNRH